MRSKEMKASQVSGSFSGNGWEAPTQKCTGLKPPILFGNFQGNLKFSSFYPVNLMRFQPVILLLQVKVVRSNRSFEKLKNAAEKRTDGGLRKIQAKR
jgi:hypothetical protein